METGRRKAREGRDPTLRSTRPCQRGFSAYSLLAARRAMIPMATYQIGARIPPTIAININTGCTLKIVPTGTAQWGMTSKTPIHATRGMPELISQGQEADD